MYKRYIVLDQNALQITTSNVTLSNLIANPKVHFVLADLGFLEMTKDLKEWEFYLRKSLEIVATVPCRVHVACSIDEALKDELETLKPVDGMLNRKATLFLRDILKSFHLNVDGHALEVFRLNCPENVAKRSEDHLNHAGNKNRALSIIDAVSEDMHEKLRRKELSGEEKLAQIHICAKYILTQMLIEKGFNYPRIKMFMKRRPMLLRRVLVDLWYSFELIEKGNYKAVKEQKFTNDLIDHHYVLTASFFNGILTYDKRMNASFNTLTNLLAMKF